MTIKLAALGLVLVAACTANGASSESHAPSQTAGASRARGCSGAVVSQARSGPAAQPAALTVPPGLTIQTIAHVPEARELAALPNGDVLVGTSGDSVYIVPRAEGPGPAGAPGIFATVGDAPAQGVAFARAICSVFIATQHAVYRIAYRDGDLTAAQPQKIAAVRQGAVAPNSDGDVHSSSSVAFAQGKVYVGVGSSCNACVETDRTRATIQEMNPDGSAMTARATRIRNAIALAANPASGHLWVGGAGQDALPTLHPYEFMDDLSSHAGVANYGWPDCEEQRTAYRPGANCTETVVPKIEFPAYQTHIGAAFYPVSQPGTHGLGPPYSGALLVASHGSWHAPGGCTIAPEVDYVPMRGDMPAIPVDWRDPKKQSKPLVTGFQNGCSARTGRATGITVGSQGSIFIADDVNGVIYRVRRKAP